MRVCIEKATGKLIESQSGGETQEHLDTLLQNAINAGYKTEDIEVKFVSGAEYQKILDAQPVPEPTEAQINEAKIQTKMRDLAIKELIKEKELPLDYK